MYTKDALPPSSFKRQGQWRSQTNGFDGPWGWKRLYGTFKIVLSDTLSYIHVRSGHRFPCDLLVCSRPLEWNDVSLAQNSLRPTLSLVHSTHAYLSILCTPYRPIYRPALLAWQQSARVCVQLRTALPSSFKHHAATSAFLWASKFFERTYVHTIYKDSLPSICIAWCRFCVVAWMLTHAYSHAGSFWWRAAHFFLLFLLVLLNAHHVSGLLHIILIPPP